MVNVGKAAGAPADAMLGDLDKLEREIAVLRADLEAVAVAARAVEKWLREDGKPVDSVNLNGLFYRPIWRSLKEALARPGVKAVLP